LFAQRSRSKVSDVQYHQLSQNMSSTFTNQNDRLQRAADKYAHNKQDWSHILETLKHSRADIKNRRFSRDPSRTIIADQSPFEISLIERTSSQFGYDDFGSKYLDKVGAPHICNNMHMPRDAADFIARKNAFYQNCRDSRVHFDPTSSKNAAIFATVPSKLVERQDKGAHSVLLRSKHNL